MDATGLSVLYDHATLLRQASLPSMSDPFRRSGPKIGRNDPCICGSGQKFKNCHGRQQHALPNLLAKEKLKRKIQEEGKRLLERHKAREMQRQKQQGLGREIISIEHKGYRIVAVGNQIYHGRWKT